MPAASACYSHPAAGQRRATPPSMRLAGSGLACSRHALAGRQLRPLAAAEGGPCLPAQLMRVGVDAGAGRPGGWGGSGRSCLRPRALDVTCAHDSSRSRRRRLHRCPWPCQQRDSDGSGGRKGACLPGCMPAGHVGCCLWVGETRVQHAGAHARLLRTRGTAAAANGASRSRRRQDRPAQPLTRHARRHACPRGARDGGWRDLQRLAQRLAARLGKHQDAARICTRTPSASRLACLLLPMHRRCRCSRGNLRQAPSLLALQPCLSPDAGLPVPAQTRRAESRCRWQMLWPRATWQRSAPLVARSSRLTELALLHEPALYHTCTCQAPRPARLLAPGCGLGSHGAGACLAMARVAAGGLVCGDVQQGLHGGPQPPGPQADLPGQLVLAGSRVGDPGRPAALSTAGTAGASCRPAPAAEAEAHPPLSDWDRSCCACSASQAMCWVVSSSLPRVNTAARLRKPAVAWRRAGVSAGLSGWVAQADPPAAL